MNTQGNAAQGFARRSGFLSKTAAIAMLGAALFAAGVGSVVADGWYINDQAYDPGDTIWHSVPVADPSHPRPNITINPTANVTVNNQVNAASENDNSWSGGGTANTTANTVVNNQINASANNYVFIFEAEQPPRHYLYDYNTTSAPPAQSQQQSSLPQGIYLPWSDTVNVGPTVSTTVNSQVNALSDNNNSAIANQNLSVNTAANTVVNGQVNANG